LWIGPSPYRTTDAVDDALTFTMEQGPLLRRGFEMSWQKGIYHTDSRWRAGNGSAP
jgi:hypothetical protein